MVLGYMPMPANFRYREVALRGRPQHKGWDAFSIKHPPMPASRWAKIFSPFDALKGFNEAVTSKEVQYVYKKVLAPDDEAELDRKLNVLHNLTWNGHMARINKPEVTVTFFVPCADTDNFAYGNAGSYETVKGTVLKVDTEVARTITLITDVGKKTISFEDLYEVDAPEISEDWRETQ